MELRHGGKSFVSTPGHAFAFHASLRNAARSDAHRDAWLIAMRRPVRHVYCLEHPGAHIHWSAFTKAQNTDRFIAYLSVVIRYFLELYLSITDAGNVQIPALWRAALRAWED
jgi:hypothetical protein